jgi:hypothetical protein
MSCPAGHVVKPTILLTATLRWPAAARLAIAFGELNCRVGVLCPRGHPVTHMLAAGQIIRHSEFLPLVSLRKAIRSVAPDLIVPCDDNAAVQLDLLQQSCRGGQPLDAADSALIGRSVGHAGACTLATMRGRFMYFAKDLVRTPETSQIGSRNELANWLSSHLLPSVIKVDSTWGGRGVAIVRTEAEAHSTFSAIAQRPALANAVLRSLADRELTPLINQSNPAPRVVTIQDFINGTSANRAVACWEGKVLAGISVLALKTEDLTGPATVVRVFEHAEMSEAATRLVKALGLSGFWGFDFVLDGSTNAAYLIEMNPRATSISHLPLGVGRDLPAALCDCLRLSSPVNPRSSIRSDVIALFPGEWRRDPTSPYLYLAHHDIPWTEPGLISDGLRKLWAERGLVARLIASLRLFLAENSKRDRTSPGSELSEEGHEMASHFGGVSGLITTASERHCVADSSDSRSLPNKWRRRAQ